MIQQNAPQRFIGSLRPSILKDQAGYAVLDLNNNLKVDSEDTAVLTRNSIEGCTGQVRTSYDSLQAHVGSLGRATSREVAESMAKSESPYVVDVVPQQPPASDEGKGTFSSTIFRFDTPFPYAEFVYEA